jgi:hypothetical protein
MPVTEPFSLLGLLSRASSTARRAHHTFSQAPRRWPDPQLRCFGALEECLFAELPLSPMAGQCTYTSRPKGLRRSAWR